MGFLLTKYNMSSHKTTPGRQRQQAAKAEHGQELTTWELELEPFSITYYHILLDPSGKTLFYQENLTFTWPNPRSFSLFPNSYFSNNF